MEKVKSILEGLLYLVVIFLSQKIIGDLYGNIVFYLSSQENSFVSKMFFSKTITLEEKALLIINQSQPIYIMIAWVVGIGIIALTLKASHQNIFPDFGNKIEVGNILMSVIIGFGIVLLTNGLILALVQYLPQSLVVTETKILEGNIFNLLFIGITIPFLEEVVFRGYIMSRLYKSGPIWFAIVIQSIMFSVSHLDVLQGISVILLGLGTGYAVIKTTSILSGIIIHSIFNITNLYLYNNNGAFFDLGQMLMYIVFGLLLTFFGIQRLRETRLKLIK